MRSASLTTGEHMARCHNTACCPGADLDTVIWSNSARRSSMIRKPGWSSFIVLSAVLSWGCASDSKSSDESAGAGALQIRPDASSPITPLVEAAGMNTENARAGALAGGDTAGTSTQSSPTSAGQASLQGGLNLGWFDGGGLLNP